MQELGIPVFGRGLDFRDPWGNLIQIVDYRDVQFTKTDACCSAMGIEGLEKSESALAELRAKGIIEDQFARTNRARPGVRHLTKCDDVPQVGRYRTAPRKPGTN